MSNEYFNPSGAPSTGSSGSSAVQRAEFVAIAAGFALLPTMLGNGDLPVFVNGTATALTTVSAASARTKLGLVIGTNVQAWDADLDALAALDATVGLLIKTAAATFTRRDVVGTANQIAVVNGNGVAGNITLSLPAAIVLTGKTVDGGTFNNTAVTNSSIGGTTGTFSGTLTPQGLVDISGASAGQIKFPATQNASANANTLDDYEEGTWTVSDSSGAGLTITNNDTAQYTKIGRLVHVQMNVNIQANANGSTTALGGLPFANLASISSLAVGIGVINPMRMTIPASGSVIHPRDPSASDNRYTNAQISGLQLCAGGSYPTS